MRASAVIALAGLLASPPLGGTSATPTGSPAAQDEGRDPSVPQPAPPTRLVLRVGETHQMVPRWAPICDDPSVAVVSRDGKGILTALAPGRTLCSVADDGGNRVLYEIVVVARVVGAPRASAARSAASPSSSWGFW